MYNDPIGKILKIERSLNKVNLKVEADDDLGYRISKIGEKKDSEPINLFDFCNDPKLKFESGFSVFVNDRICFLSSLVMTFSARDWDTEFFGPLVRKYEVELLKSAKKTDAFFDFFREIFYPTDIVIPKNVTICWLDGVDNDIVTDITEITNPKKFTYLKVSRLHFNQPELSLELLNFNKKISLSARCDKFIPFYVSFCRQINGDVLCLFSIEPISRFKIL